MSQVDAINLFLLRNNEHFQFMTDVDTLISKFQSEPLGIHEEYSVFKTALAAEEAALRVENGSSKTEEIRKANKLRNRTWKAIEKRIESTVLSPFEEEVSSARILERVMNTYGNLSSLSYNEKSGRIENLTEDLQKPENDVHLSLTGVTAWVAELKKQNKQFQLVLSERNSELATRISGDVAAKRIIIDPLYKAIKEKINASVVMNLAGPEVDPFIGEMNEKISYYINTITIRRSRKKNSGTQTDKTSPDVAD